MIPSHFEIYKAGKGNGREWRWRLRGDNNEILASGESYKRRVDCVGAITLIRNLPADVKIRERPA